MTTSALEREILTHYYVSPEPYQSGPAKWNTVVKSLISRFIREGFLIAPMPGTFIDVKGNNAALAAYMEALAAVPLPVQKWVVP